MFKPKDLVVIKSNRLGKWAGCYAEVVEELYPTTNVRWYLVKLNDFKEEQYQENELEKV